MNTQRAPMAGIELLLIDGNNLMHRTSGSADPSALRLLIARLRGRLPPEIMAIVMLDGHAAPGTGRQHRVARNLEIHHAGSISADDALLGLIRRRPAHTRPGITLVTDDRALRDKARYLGAHTQRLQWLLDDGGEATQIGAGRPKAPPSPGPTPGSAQNLEDPEEERQPWQPGRGATKKRGNPRRARR